MTEKQELILKALRRYIDVEGLQILQEKEIQHGYQLQVSNGVDSCVLSVYQSGKVVPGGKKSNFRDQMEEWKNLQLAVMENSPNVFGQTSDDSGQNHSTKYIVAPEKYDKILEAIHSLPAQVAVFKGTVGHEVYKADIRAEGNRVALTQYQTGTLLVQGKATSLFDGVCHLLDSMLVQSPAEHATRYVSEEQANQVKCQIEHPDAEKEAWQWLANELEPNILNYLEPYDRNTLVAGAMLLDAAQELQMPDFSALVMPFARAFEGFLIKLCVHIGLANEEAVRRDLRNIRVGLWLEEIPKLLEDPRRDKHIQTTLLTAWEGTRHLMLHSDPSRQTTIPTYDKAVHEICGVLMRAFTRGYNAFVLKEIPTKESGRKDEEETAPETAITVKETAKKKDKWIPHKDEALLIELLKEAGYDIEFYDKPNNPNKWRIVTKELQVFCPRDLDYGIILRGSGCEDLFERYSDVKEKHQENPELLALPPFVPHIGADEAGKGDYFGPLVTAAVFVDSQTRIDLIRVGVRDSKSLSDTTIADLALKIRECCPNVVEILMPIDYNAAYEKQRNLNSLLAGLHTKTIEQLIQKTNCSQVLVDQFADKKVLEQAMANIQDLQLEQRTKGESDIAVAAASILARETFVAVIEDLRVKSELHIPLGSSSPDVVRVGKVIIKKWGEAGLKRIAKVGFKTTQKILTTR